MTRRIPTLAALVVASALVVGCESTNYSPKGESTQIAAYAAKSNYPSMGATGNPGLLYAANDDGSVVLNNGTQTQLSDFEVWINGKYVLHVTKLNPLSYVTLTADTLYDKNGNRFSDSDNKTVTSVEVKDASGFMRVMGPVKPQVQQQ